MLHCEKYIGDAILQKTYTIDFLTKKKVLNNGYVKKYYVRNSHEAIISKEQFYQVQEEMKRRCCAVDKSIRKRYSSAYPLSGLIICGKCNGIYTRVTWQKKNIKTFVWRCRERLKSGSVQCKRSLTVKEADMIRLLSELFNTIIKTLPDVSTVYLIQTKAVLMVKLKEKEEFDDGDITKQLLNMVIDRIAITDDGTSKVYFKSGLIMEKTLS